MKYFFASLCILLIVSCSVQKRHYQKGFYISRDASVPSKSPAAKKQVTVPQPDPAYLSADARTDQPDLSLASNKVLISMPQEDSCDVIIFRDGTELRTRWAVPEHGDGSSLQATLTSGGEFAMRSWGYSAKFVCAAASVCRG